MEQKMERNPSIIRILHLLLEKQCVIILWNTVLPFVDLESVFQSHVTR